MSGLYSKTITRSYATEGVIGRYTGMGIGSEYGLTYGYDAYGRLNSVANGADTFAYGYVADSDLTGSVTYPNNISVTNTYEAQRDLLTSVENKHGATTISRYDYANNAIGNRVSMAKSGTAFAQADTITYGYNDRSEVTSATAQLDTAYNYAYGYDNIGNRVTATEAGTAKAYTSNALNQYTAITNPAQAPAYDNDGDMTSDGTGWTYTWDAENRLKSATNGTRTLEFKYDYLSRRVEKKVTDSGAVSKHEKFVYDGYKQIERLDALNSNGVVQKFVWQDETLLSMSDSAGTCYYLQDANKNIGQVLDSSGAFKARYEYSPFGKLTVAEDTSGNPFRFSSEYFDEETGLVYYNFRYYSPDLGRWLSKDPIEEESGWNLYCMVRNNPVTLWDLLGLEGCQCKSTKDVTAEEVEKMTEAEQRAFFERLQQEEYERAKATLETIATYDPTGITGVVDSIVRKADGDAQGAKEEFIMAIIPGGCAKATIGEKILQQGEKAIGGIIKGFTKHGINQAISRDSGKGVASKGILDAVKNPIKTVKQGGGVIKYKGENATVIVNKDGKVITAYGQPRNP